MQIVNQAAFVVSYSYHCDEITIYLQKNRTCLHWQTKNYIMVTSF